MFTKTLLDIAANANSQKEVHKVLCVLEAEVVRGKNKHVELEG